MPQLHSSFSPWKERAQQLFPETCQQVKCCGLAARKGLLGDGIRVSLEGDDRSGFLGRARESPSGEGQKGMQFGGTDNQQEFIKQFLKL